MRRPLAALLIFLAIGPLPGSQHIPVRPVGAETASARPLLFPAGKTGMMRFVRGWRLVSPHHDFGGFSALARLGPGTFRMVGDNGQWVRLTLREDGGLSGLHMGPTPTPAGKSRRKSQNDVEAMAVDPASGKTWLALEGINQIWRLDPALARIESRARLPEPRWPANRGPEAMARLSDGRTIIFSEDADDDPRGREGLVYAGDPAVPETAAFRFYYDSGGKGQISDAAALPDGRILLIHRRVGFDPVFTTTVALVDPADIREGGVVTSRAIGRVPDALAENYEGAAIGVEAGRTYLWLVSDDNFNSWQRHLLVQFELVGLPPKKAPDSKKAAR